MNHFCQRCKKADSLPFFKAVYLIGYWPRRMDGIAIAENARKTEFCSRECFLKFMAKALESEKPDLELFIEDTSHADALKR